MKNSHIKDLLLLLAVPATIAVVAAAVIYVPKLLAKPTYDFMYSMCNDYRCTTKYSVADSGRVEQDNPESSDLYGNPAAETLAYYDVSEESSRTISFEEAQRYQLDTSAKSPDGYTLGREDSRDGFLFWGDYDRDWYLKDGAKKKKVVLTQEGSYYSDNVTFLGWIEK